MLRPTLLHLHNRGEPIRVAGVVVVDIAARVHIPRIVGIASIRRTQPNVLSYNLRPVLLFVRFMPFLQHGAGFFCQLGPILFLFMP